MTTHRATQALFIVGKGWEIRATLRQWQRAAGSDMTLIEWQNCQAARSSSGHMDNNVLEYTKNTRSCKMTLE
ncbi:Z-ring formation inhibitor MciZ [Paenibacillus massiliensis]|uniref:Z-ring formation inhibitor MciZ n=1 Tax=Paenibacillus massiliensis TaxID=225917 RepID=UPI0004164DFD|nr:Z-ring formation inhibitor MciZ [Paenibacillus massiliensis]